MRVYAIVAGLTLGCFLLPRANGQEWDLWTPEVQRIHVDGALGLEFWGHDLALDSDVCVVGSEISAVAVFRCDDDTLLWTEEQVISFDEGGFGASVDLSGTTFVAGDGRDDENGSRAGAAYVYVYDDDLEEWVEQQKLLATDGGGGDEFGVTVAINEAEELIVVGAEGDRPEDVWRAGSVYVFRRDSGEEEWYEEQKLTRTDPEADDRFGNPLALCDDRIFVGHRYDDEEGTDAGAVYVFEYDADEEEWVEVEQLTASNAASDDGFGFSIACESDRLAVTSLSGDDGSVYVFDYDDASEEWAETQQLEASDADDPAGFGSSLSMSIDTLLVGAPRDGTFLGGVGSAYVYSYDDTDEEWLEIRKLNAADSIGGERFGHALAVSGTQVMVGAPRDSGDNHDWWRRGTVYSYDLSPPHFLRGDADSSGEVESLVDAVYIMSWAFVADEEPPCMDAADANGDGLVLALVDSIHLLTFGFLSGEEPPAPGPDACGEDMTYDTIRCLETADVCL